VKEMGYRYFTADEDEIIRSNTLEKAAQLLPNRDKESIAARAKRLGLNVNRASRWSPEEDEILRHEYPVAGEEGVKKHLPEKTTACIVRRAKQLGLINDGWSKDEDYIIFKSGCTYSQELDSRLPGRTPCEISRRCRTLSEERNRKISYPLNIYIGIFGTYKGYDRCYVSFERYISSIKNMVLSANPEHLGFMAFFMHFENAMDNDFIAKELGVTTEKVERLISDVLSGYKTMLRRRGMHID
jgi:hypothetical protein